MTLVRRLIAWTVLCLILAALFLAPVATGVWPGWSADFIIPIWFMYLIGLAILVVMSLLGPRFRDTDEARAILDRRRASGDLTDAEYEREVAKLRRPVHQDSHHRAAARRSGTTEIGRHDQ